MTKRTYYRYTTYQQRKLLFETWKETSKITLASQKAHVSRGLFYYWKARFDEKGYAGLEEYDSFEAHKLNKKDESLEQKVIEMKKDHNDWGKRRIADEMAKANNWEPIVSANTVRRILHTAGLWPESGAGEKKGLTKA
jgi:transposase